MTALWDKKASAPARHADPDAAMAEYMEELRRAEVAGATPPAGALNGLGDAYLDKGDIVTAVDYYRQAAEVYAEEGMHDNAVACCKKIRRYRPEDPAVGLMLGRYYAAKGLKADARAELDVFADRARENGDLERAAEALEEIVRIDPEAHEKRETLADVYEKAERKDDAEEAYRAALEGYRSDGDRAAAERVRDRLGDLSDEDLVEEPPEEPVEETRAPDPDPEPSRVAAREDDSAETEPPLPESAREDEPGAPDAERPLDMGLEIERTSYDEESPVGEDVEEEIEPLTVAQEGAETEDTDEGASVVEPSDPGREPHPVAEEEPEPERPRGSDDPERAESPTYAEMFAEAGRRAREGDEESAAELLVRAASGLQEEARWPEAVASYRQLAQLGGAEEGHYEAWAECARQVGEPVKVLEALESRARWHLEKDEAVEARKAAEEMLLVDPDSDVASRLLEEIGVGSE